MDNQTPDDKSSKLKRPAWVELFSKLLSPEESAAMTFYYGGCMGVIVLVTFLIRWLLGIFKGF